MAAKNFDDILAIARDYGPIRIAIAGGEDPNIAEAVSVMIAQKLISRAYITGNKEILTQLYPPNDAIRLIDADDPSVCATIAVKLTRDGDADILAKGHIDSTSYLRAVVNRAQGLRTDRLLSNITVATMPSLDRLIAATDNGITPLPSLAQKRDIILNTAPLFHGLGITPINTALIAPSEKITTAIPATTDAAQLSSETLQGFAIGGPYGYDVAISSEAAKIKNLSGKPAAGNANLLVFSNIEAANAVAKSWKYHGQAETGSIVLGARAPVLLNSRSDSAARRVNALILATATLAGQKST